MDNKADIYYQRILEYYRFFNDSSRDIDNSDFQKRILYRCINDIIDKNHEHLLKDSYLFFIVCRSFRIFKKNESENFVLDFGYLCHILNCLADDSEFNTIYTLLDYCNFFEQGYMIGKTNNQITKSARIKYLIIKDYNDLYNSYNMQILRSGNLYFTNLRNNGISNEICLNFIKIALAYSLLNNKANEFNCMVENFIKNFDYFMDILKLNGAINPFNMINKTIMTMCSINFIKNSKKLIK